MGEIFLPGLACFAAVFGHSNAGFFLLLHDLEWDDEELDSELVSQWRVNLEVMRDVLKKEPWCVGADGRMCKPSALKHPFLLPPERHKNHHDQ